MVTYARANRCLQHNPATQTTSTCPSPISYLYPMFQVLVICRCWSIHLPRLFCLSQYTHAVYARLKLACHEAFVTRSVAYYCMLDLAMWCECHDNVMKTIAQYARMLFSSSEIARTAIEQSVLASNCSSMTRLRHRLPSAPYHMHAEDSLSGASSSLALIPGVIMLQVLCCTVVINRSVPWKCPLGLEHINHAIRSKPGWLIGADAGTPKAHLRRLSSAYAPIFLNPSDKNPQRACMRSAVRRSTSN